MAAAAGVIVTTEVGNEMVVSELITVPAGERDPDIVGTVPRDVTICVAETISRVAVGVDNPEETASTARMANPWEPAGVLLDISMPKKLLYDSQVKLGVNLLTATAKHKKKLESMLTPAST